MVRRKWRLENGIYSFVLIVQPSGRPLKSFILYPNETWENYVSKLRSSDYPGDGLCLYALTQLHSVNLTVITSTVGISFVLEVKDAPEKAFNLNLKEASSEDDSDSSRRSFYFSKSILLSAFGGASFFSLENVIEGKYSTLK